MAQMRVRSGALTDFKILAARDDVAGMRHLRDQDCVGRRLGRCQQIGRSPNRLQRVGADDELASAIAPFTHRSADPLTRLYLGLWRY